MGYKKIEIKVTAGPNASNKAKVMEPKINKIAISVLLLIYPSFIAALYIK